MLLDEFIESLYKAGWGSSADAGHEKIKALHKKLWPEIAMLESQLADGEEEILRLLEGGFK